MEPVPSDGDVADFGCVRIKMFSNDIWMRDFRHKENAILLRISLRFKSLKLLCY